ncbi:hypothetical protein [Dissulfurirhabdus thermomarina]|nr:hypothetical protein [Dissulfurirhabdus thermomarina]
MTRASEATQQPVAFCDAITGSAHSTLIPCWAKRFGKNKLHAYQLSSRKGNWFVRIWESVSGFPEKQLHLQRVKYRRLVVVAYSDLLMEEKIVEINENKMKWHFDIGSLVVIVVTFILFVLALIVKGFTHDLLIESAVFLISVKLILMSYKNSAIADELMKEIKEIRDRLESGR